MLEVTLENAEVIIRLSEIPVTICCCAMSAVSGRMKNSFKRGRVQDASCLQRTVFKGGELNRLPPTGGCLKNSLDPGHRHCSSPQPALLILLRPSCRPSNKNSCGPQTPS